MEFPPRFKLASLFTMFFASLSLLAAGCRSQTTASELKWGELTDMDRGLDPKLYYFGIKPTDTLHGCIDGQWPKGLSQDWVKAEIYTAVNLWAMTIGRSLTLAFDGCAGQPTLRVAFAPAPIGGDFIGYTWFHDGERQIFLNPAYDWEDIGQTLGFNKMPDLQRDNWQAKAAFLLPIVADQAYSTILLKTPGPTGKPRQPSFGTLLHEAGHGFGLCDLYTDASDAPDFNDNCSKTYRASSIDPAEVMTAGTRPGTARFHLAAADIAGLQQISKRSGFPTAGWPSPSTTLTSAQVISRLNTTSSGARGEPSAPGVTLEGPARTDYDGEHRTAVVRLVVKAPKSSSGVFLHELSGRGQAAQLDPSDAKIVGEQLVWSVDLTLDSDSAAYHYAATLNDDVGVEAKLSFSI